MDEEPREKSEDIPDIPPDGYRGFFRRWWETRLPWVFFFVGLALVVLALWKEAYWPLEQLRFFADHRDRVLEVLKELGMAFIIAGIASLSIERARARAFSADLSKEVKDKLTQIERATTDLILRGPLPPEYYEHVMKGILSPRFLRLDWIVRVEMSWNDRLDPNHEFLEFSLEQNYKIKNLNGFSATYPIDHFESGDWDDRYPGSTHIRYLRAYLEGSPKAVVNEGETSKANEEGFVHLGSKQEIPAKGILHVQTASAKMLRDRQLETRIIGEPTMGAQFTIRFPADLKVSLELPEILLEGKSYNPKIGEESLSDGARQSHWLVPRPMPPYTYINITWRKVAPEPHKPPATPPAAGS